MNLDRILVPLDGSPESEHILGEVSRVGTRDTILDLVHILPDASPPPDAAPGFDLTLEEHAAEYLESVARRISGRTVRTYVWRGEAAEEIALAARRLKSRLIAMTTHPRTGWTNFFMGSTSEEVVRKTALPVLLTHPDLRPPDRGLERILVAVDGTDRSARMIGTVEAIAAETGAEVELLQVVGPLIVSDPVTGFVAVPRTDPAPDPTPALERLGEPLRYRGLRVRVKAAYGDAAEQIVAEARSAAADWIAMATTGRQGLSRFLWGSVAEAVLRTMDRPMLLHRIPPPRSKALKPPRHHPQNIGG